MFLDDESIQIIHVNHIFQTKHLKHTKITIRRIPLAIFLVSSLIRLGPLTPPLPKWGRHGQQSKQTTTLQILVTKTCFPFVPSYSMLLKSFSKFLWLVTNNSSSYFLLLGHLAAGHHVVAGRKERQSSQWQVSSKSHDRGEMNAPSGSFLSDFRYFHVAVS